MTDIAERLRSYARNLGGRAEDYLTWQAAEEIERLRAALESLTKDPPATLAREPDTDDEVIIKMRAIAREALTGREGRE